MTALTTVRNLLAAIAACALLLFLAHALRPMLAANLPGKDALSAVYGLGCLVIPIVYKLIDGALGAVGFGRRSAPAQARGVTMIAGGAVLALVWGVFAFVAAHGLAQMALIAKGAPAAEAFIRSAQGHLSWIKLATLLAAALFTGAWIGRRHGRGAALTALGAALFGCATLLTVDVLSGLRSAAIFPQALKALRTAHDLKGLLMIVRELELHLLLALFLTLLVGSLLGGGGRRTASVERLVRPLHLGAD